MEVVPPRPRPSSPASELQLDLYLISDRLRFQQLLDGSAGSVLLVERDGVLRYLSPPARTLFSGHPYAPLGQSILSYVHRQDLYFVLRGLKAVSSGSAEQASWLFRLLQPEGTWRWLNAAAARFQYAGGREVTAIFLHDLSSRTPTPQVN